MPGCPQQAVDGGIAQQPGARRLQGLARGRAVQHIQHATVRHQHDVLAGVARSQGVGGVQHTLAQLQQGFAAFGGVVGFALAPAAGVLGQLGFNVGKGAAFKNAKAALAQPRRQVQRGCGALGHGLGGGQGALQITAVNGAGWLVRQGVCQLARLPLAGGVQSNVQAALNACVAVPGRFAVAHGGDAGAVL